MGVAVRCLLCVVACFGVVWCRSVLFVVCCPLRYLSFVATYLIFAVCSLFVCCLS